MPEENQHNDNLEQFFQKKAGEFNIPFREEDWLKLEKRLDIRDLKIAHRRRIAWILAASILIISLLGYFTYENHNRLNRISDMLTESSEPELQQVQPVERPAPSEIEVLLSSEEPPDANQAEQETASDSIENLAEAATGIGEGNSQREFAFEPARIEKKTLVEENLTLAHNATTLPHISDGMAVTLLNQLHIPDRGYDNPETYADGRTFSHQPEFGFDSDRFERSGFAASIVASPDFSTAGSRKGFHETGYKIGLLAEYRITKRLSVISGLVFSDVRYNAYNREYNPPGYWNTGIVPDETTALCLILDIPVSLKFDFLNFERSGFYATAGLSSYIMLNEDYRFRYDEGGYDLEDHLKVRNGTRHWFNNANLSVGYELDIHPNWSLRAEPFIKIPVSGVGWGDVKLYSMGSFVSLNYQL